jgi:hypothetical protein
LLALTFRGKTEPFGDVVGVTVAVSVGVGEVVGVDDGVEAEVGVAVAVDVEVDVGVVVDVDVCVGVNVDVCVDDEDVVDIGVTVGVRVALIASRLVSGKNKDGPSAGLATLANGAFPAVVAVIARVNRKALTAKMTTNANKATVSKLKSIVSPPER